MVSVPVTQEIGACVECLRRGSCPPWTTLCPNPWGFPSGVLKAVAHELTIFFVPKDRELIRGVPRSVIYSGEYLAALPSQNRRRKDWCADSKALSVSYHETADRIPC